MRRILVPVVIGIIGYGYLLSRADDPRAEKIRELQGLAGEMVSIRIKNSDTTYHVEHALVKSLGGEMFMTGRVLHIREKNSQQPPAKAARVLVPLREIQALIEYETNPFVKPPAPKPDATDDSK